MKNKTEAHNSYLIDEIFESISPKEEKRIRQKMLLAAKIEDAMKAKGWNKTKLLKEMGQKNPSIATKWFSGTHNFTTDTLLDLQGVLGIKLINIEEVSEEVVIKFHVVVQSEPMCQSHEDLIHSFYKKPTGGRGKNIPFQIQSFKSIQTIAEA
jgi:hypothetical protein